MSQVYWGIALKIVSLLEDYYTLPTHPSAGAHLGRRFFGGRKSKIYPKFSAYLLSSQYGMILQNLDAVSEKKSPKWVFIP